MERGFINKIKSIVGTANVEETPEQLYTYTYDASFGTADSTVRPGLAVSPASAEEISAVMALCNQYEVAVIPRGAGSNLSGGTLPVNDCLFILTQRMDSILEIDRDNMLARVQPGVVTAKLQRSVEEMGLFYPPDPASLNFCTIGGNLAECAGGPRGLKYGVTRDYVLGLEAVLADGRVLKTGTKTIKGVTGYDLTRLLIGSEGTLAIFTEATLRLVPKPPAQQTVLAIFDDVRGAAETVNKILLAGVIPACIEFLDKKFIACIEDYAKIGLPVDSEAVLLIEVDGQPEALDKGTKIITEVCNKSGAREIASASTSEKRDELWTARRAAFASISRLRPSILTEDIVVPRNSFADMVITAQEIAEKYQLQMAILGHAGDGNLHADIITDENDAEEMHRVTQAVKELLAEVLRFGGTISGEHGIGFSKAKYLQLELDAVASDTMQQMKTVLDPKNILNPGKLFPL